ncbi:MAG TPA: hypothetical protein VFQ35_09695 [Polyangiaceae bacterium]|nr:hypothetical protein [Polyangiaceae bacterium]
MKSPRIVTHLFADGGRIIKTARTSYAELVGRSDLAQTVRQMMKEQHRSMFASLRAGELDAMLEAACGPLPLPPVERSEAAERPAASLRDPATAPQPEPAAVSSPKPVASAPSPAARSLSNPNLHRIPPSVPPPSREDLEIAVGAVEKLSVESPSATMPVANRTDSARARKSTPPGARKSRTPAVPSVATRPSARAASSKPAQSIFGDSVISEKSLDEVILSYLAEDLDGPSE